ncbi:MAG: tetratricopeptide repeat protein [Planctomycetota bacterium]
MTEQAKPTTKQERVPEPAPYEQERGPKWKLLIGLGVLLLVIAVVGASFVVVRKARVQRAMLADLQEGYELLEAGQPDRARILIGPFVQANPDDVEAKYAYARANRQVEQPNGRHIIETIGFLRQILNTDPNHTEAERDLVELSVLLGLNNDVLRMTADLPPEPMSDPVLLESRTLALAATGDLDDALTYARAYNQALPADLLGHVRTLEIFRASRADEEVIRARAEEVAAPMTPARSAVIRGFAERILGNHERGVELAKQAAADPETDVKFVAPLVNLLDGYGEYELSLAVLENAADVDDLDARIRFAQRLWEGGRYAALLGLTEDLDPSDPTADARLLGLRGLGLIGEGRRDEVAPIVAGLLERPEGTRGHAWAAILPVWPDERGLFSVATADVADSIAAARAALSLGQHASFEYLLGVSLARAGEPIAAAEHLQVAARLAPSWKAPAVDHLRTLLASGRGNESVRAARVLLQRGRSDPETLAVVAEAIARLSGDANSKGIDDALQLLEDALEIDPGSVEAIVLKANLLAEREDVDGARALLAPLLEDPNVFADTPRAGLRASQLARRLDMDAQRLLNDVTWPGEDARIAFARERAVGAASSEAAIEAMQLTGGGASVALSEIDLRLAMGDDRTAVGERIAALAEQYPARIDIQQRAAAASATIAQRRAAVERLVGLVEPYGLNWPTTAAVLVLQQADERGQTLPERELSELALRVSAVTRAYENAVEPRLVLAEVLTRLESRDEAIKQVAEATRAVPDNIPLRLKLAEMLQREGEFGRADQHLRTVEELVARPSVRASDGERRLLAQLLTGAGQAERAVAVLEGLPRTGDLPDMQLLELYRRQGAMDPEIIAKLLESGETAQLLFVIDYFASRGDKEGIATALDRLTSSELSPAELARVRGDAAARSGDLAGALESYRASVADDPSNRETWRRLVIANFSLGDIPAAIAAAAEAADKLENGGAYALFAEKLAAADASENLLRDIPQVGEVLTTLLVNDADNEAAARMVDTLIAARTQDQQLDELTEALAVIAADAPRLYEVQDLLTRIAMLASKWDIAYEAAERSARFDPIRIEPARFAAEAKAQAREWDEVIDLARRWEQRSISAGSNPLPAILLRARARLAQDQASRTLALLRPYRERMREDPAAYAEVIAVYSEALLQRNSGSEALPLLEPLVQEMPFARRIYIRILGSQWPDAADAADKLAAIDPVMRRSGPAEMILLARGWKDLERRGVENNEFDTLVLAAATQMLGSDQTVGDGLIVETAMLGTDLLSREELTALYRKALSVNPENPIALNNLAMQLIEEPTDGSLEEALSHAERVAAIEDHPAHAYFLDTLASVQRARGELSDAARSLYEATRAEPQNPRWFANLAEVQLEQNLPDAARPNWEEAKRLAAGRRNLEPETQATLARLDEAFE